jgi:hypothetical protein
VRWPPPQRAGSCTIAFRLLAIGPCAVERLDLDYGRGLSADANTQGSGEAPAPRQPAAPQLQSELQSVGVRRSPQQY